MSNKITITQSDPSEYTHEMDENSTIVTTATNYTLPYPIDFGEEVIEFDKDQIDALFEDEHFIKKLKQFMFKETLEKL